MVVEEATIDGGRHSTLIDLIFPLYCNLSNPVVTLAFDFQGSLLSPRVVKLLLRSKKVRSLFWSSMSIGRTRKLIPTFASRDDVPVGWGHQEDEGECH